MKYNTRYPIKNTVLDSNRLTLSIRKHQIRTLRSNEFLFCAALLLYVFNYVLSTSTIIALIPASILRLGYILSGLALFLSEVTYSRWNLESVLLALLSLNSIIVILSSGTFSIALTLMFLIVGRHHSIERTSRVMLFGIAFLSLIIVLASYSGIAINYSWRRANGTVRWGLGFRYTTTLPHNMLIVLMLLLILRKGKLYFWQIILFEMINVILHILSNSRNTFILMSILLLWSLLYRLFYDRFYDSTGSEPRSVVVSLFSLYFPFLITVSVIMMLNYTPLIPWMRDLNNLLGGRLGISRYTYLLYGVSAFGQSLSLVGNGLSSTLSLADSNIARTYLDNSYLFTLVNYGYVTLVLFGMVFSVMMRKSVQARNNVFVFLLLVYGVYALIDNVWLRSLVTDPFLIFAGRIILNKPEIYREELS